MFNTSLNHKQLAKNSSPNAVDIRHLSRILLRRRFLALGVSCVVMSVTNLMAILHKPTYESYMQILVTSNLSEGVGADNKSIDYSAQMKLMMSSQLIEKAVNLLHLDYPDLTLEDIKSQKENGKKAPLQITQLEDKTTANYVVNPIIEISFNDEDPTKAKKILQALQKVYQDYNIEQRQERLNKGLAFINVRLPAVKKQLAKAEKNLEIFRKKNNFLDPELQSRILVESFNDIQKQLQTTRAQLQDIRARYANLEQQIVSSSQDEMISSRLAQSERYQTLLQEIQKTQIALAKEQLRYTDDSPIVKNLQQQRQSQLVLLQEEFRQITHRNSKGISQTKSQTSEVEPKLIQELIQMQTTALGLVANEKSLTESEQRIRLELSQYPSLIAEYNRLLPEVQTNRQTLEQLLQLQQSLGMKIAQGGFDWQVVEEPTQGRYLTHYRLLLVAGGLVFGPTLGIFIALIFGMQNRVISSPKQLHKLTKLRLLGLVPKLVPQTMKKRLSSFSVNGGENAASSLIESGSWLPCHEDLDILYQNIKILKYPFSPKSLMLTSALPGEGKTTLALGLAASAAHINQRVLVIDANLRSPQLHNILNLSNDWGLSLLLLDETDSYIHDYIQPIHPSIDILTAGPIAEDSIKLLSSGRMKELLSLFEQSYDLVLIDGLPILGTVDARIVASLCDGIMLIARIGYVSQNELTEAIENLYKLNLIGIVVNQVSSSHK